MGARDILRRNGIDIDSFWNGVKVTKSFHASLHSHRYITRITDLLSKAETRGGSMEVRRELLRIADKLGKEIMP